MWFADALHPRASNGLKHKQKIGLVLKTPGSELKNERKKNKETKISLTGKSANFHRNSTHNGKPRDISRGCQKPTQKEERSSRMQCSSHASGYSFYVGSCVGLVPHHEQTGLSNMVLHCTAFEQRLAKMRGGWSGRRSAGYTTSFSSAISCPTCSQYFSICTCQTTFCHICLLTILIFYVSHPK